MATPPGASYLLTPSVGIGTNAPQHQLDVHGAIRSAFMETNRLLISGPLNTITNSTLDGLDAAYLKAAIEDTIEVSGTNVDFALGPAFHKVLTTNTIFAFTNTDLRTRISMLVSQDGGGPYPVTFPDAPSGSWYFLSGEADFPATIDGPVLFFFALYGSQWVADWSGVPANELLSGLLDVDLDTPTENQSLRYDAISGKWTNRTDAASGNYVLADDGSVTNVNVYESMLLNHLTASRVAILDANKRLTNSAAVDTTELEHLDGVTSAIQTQLNTKMATADDDGTNITFWAYPDGSDLAFRWYSSAGVLGGYADTNGLLNPWLQVTVGLICQPL